METLSLWLHINVLINHKNLRYVFTQKYLKLRRIRWLKLLKGYYMSELYHPRKNNVVVNSLSRLSMCSVTHIVDAMKEIVKEVHRLAHFVVLIEDSSKGGFMVSHNSELYH